MLSTAADRVYPFDAQTWASTWSSGRGTLVQIQCLDEGGGRPDLPAAVRAEEAPELLLDASTSPLGLSLEGPERDEISLLGDDSFHGSGAE